MIAGQTRRSSARQMRRLRGQSERAPFDPKAKRYFIYRLHDAAGAIVYIGRSCDVAARIKSHHREAASPFYEGRKSWMFDVRRVSMVGPFAWDEACRVERAEIESHQPRGNRMFTKAHGYRPLEDGGGRYLDSA